MKHETAGDPMTGLKWTRRTTAKIAAGLEALGIEISDRTTARLLKQMNFSLRVNHKKRSKGSRAKRNAQFARIAELRDGFSDRNLPIISIDTKKRELVGCFKNAGTAWTREPVAVNDHDFRSDALGVAIPYGIYDLHANRGSVFVGTTYDTPAFAVDSIERWWRIEGKERYPEAIEIAILADAGGSNSSTSRAWKYGLQTQLCNRHGISITVAHYPSGASKWNPIEHRLFSEISKNWAGRPLDEYETILKYIRSTKTSTGLTVGAHFVRKHYQKGVKISDEQMKELVITTNNSMPKWNYTLRPN